MPGQNGVDFLSKVAELAPESVRLMLTGQADLEVSTCAINQCKIFRFLTKPLLPDDLRAAIGAALAHYRQRGAERDLLEKTLASSVNALTEVLALVNPAAFARSVRLRGYVAHMVRRLRLAEPWEHEMAAMLSQIGSVTLPPDAVERYQAGTPRDEAERLLLAGLPAMSASLIEGIPRLERVAQMIAGQGRSPEEWKASSGESEHAPVALGAQMIRVAIEFDRQLARGLGTSDAAEAAAAHGTHDTRLVELLAEYRGRETESTARNVPLAQLAEGMILDQEVVAANGVLLVGRGQEVTFALIQRLRNFARGVGVPEPIRVLCPAESEVAAEVER